MGMAATARIALSAALAVCVAGCGWPKDPRHTTNRVEGGVVRVGVTDNAPYVRLQPGGASGIEPDIARLIAADAHARIDWIPAAEGVLLNELKEGQLDLALVGATQQNPWVKELGAPKPYGKLGREGHLILAPPGENAWLLRIDRVIHDHKDMLQAR